MPSVARGAADEIFTDSEWLHKDMRGRISALKPDADQEIYRCLDRLAERPNERARAIALCREPWTDLMLLPARSWRIGDPKATALCYVHRDELPSADRCAQLADLFGLAPHEARMALCLSRGMTIAEAAEQQNLTIGSGRMYTKAIYAKTGARGLPDLLRIISRSILAISM